jgi:GAF domain-containing protein
MKKQADITTSKNDNLFLPSESSLDAATAIALRDLLDPSFEDAYDRLTLIATKLLKVPVSLVSVASAEDQYFKSFVGLGQPWADHRISTRSDRYCRHVVNTGKVLEIEDAQSDVELKDDPVTKEMGVVAYLGIPMTLKSGVTLGSFCAIDTKRRKWTPEERLVMHELNESLMREIELRLALKQTQTAKQLAEQANKRVINILDSMLDAGM